MCLQLEVQASFCFIEDSSSSLWMDPRRAADGQPRVNKLGFCEFEEVQILYSLSPDTLGYDISNKTNQPSKSPKLDFLFREMSLTLLVKSLHLMKSRFGHMYVKRPPNWWNGFQTVFGIVFDRWLKQSPGYVKVRGKHKDEQSPASSATWVTVINLLSCLLVCAQLCLTLCDPSGL